MRIVFTRLDLIPRKLPERAAILSDELAARELAEIGIQPHFQVRAPDILELEEVKALLDSGGFKSIVAFGGWAAASAARALAVKKHKRLSLRESLFEYLNPSVPVVAVPFSLGFCTPLSEITVIWDSMVPVYYALLMPLDAVWLPLDKCAEAFLRDPLEAEALRAEAELLGLEPLDPSNCSAVLRFCRSYAVHGPGPLLLASASVAAVAGVEIATALKAVLEAFRNYSCEGWLRRAARRKLDLLAEHAWSYYSSFLTKIGVRSSYELLKLLRRVLACCL
ncbi:MAG: hypothetical protein QXJ21_03650 [Thermofilum sp.]